jgi:hypothetical protein
MEILLCHVQEASAFGTFGISRRVESFDVLCELGFVCVFPLPLAECGRTIYSMVTCKAPVQETNYSLQSSAGSLCCLPRGY